MDETIEERMPAVEEATAVEEQPAAEGECCRRRCGGLCGGLISGAVVGGVLALLLAPRRREERARREMLESGGWEGREGVAEEEWAKVGLERAEAVVGGVASRIVAAWATVRERLRDAVEEGKEGMAEGQAEARARYEFMTKRRRPRR